MQFYSVVWRGYLRLHIVIIRARSLAFARIIFRECFAHRLPPGTYWWAEEDRHLQELTVERPDMGEDEGYFRAPDYRTAKPCVLLHSPFHPFSMRLHNLKVLATL